MTLSIFLSNMFCCKKTTKVYRNKYFYKIMISEIKLFLEFHWAVRQPTVQFKINNLELFPLKFEILPAADKFTENVILTFNSKLDSVNLLELCQTDKTNNDLLNVNGDIIDHWIAIRDISVDGIHFKTALFNSYSKFVHSMPAEWVNDMNQQGYNIDPVYYPGTELRLNGVWSTKFTTPVWEWCVTNYSN
jgi:hypothetical protein